MATRFDSLALADPRIFGVRVHGAFGRGDRQRLVELAARCLQERKTRLVLECSGLDSLGGGGAAVLADLQRDLQAQGGEAVFVGPGQVVRRFLTRKFGELPLRIFDDVSEATAALTPEVAADGEAAPHAAAGASAEPDPPPGGRTVDPAEDPAGADLDVLLDDVEVVPGASDATTRRTADLVTAPYVSLEEALLAAGGGNAALLGETLAVLLDGHDLAAETILCTPRGDHYVALDGRWRLPVEGAIVASLTRTGRPLTMLDLEDGALWDEETELLEQLQPDIILPVIRGGTLEAVLLLQHASPGHDYSLSEMFALEVLQRLLATAADPAGAPCPAAASDPSGTAGADHPDRGPAAAPGPRVAVPASAPGGETMLHVKLELARGLQDAQDVPHFWQVFISRLRLGAEVTSLAFLDADPAGDTFLAGEARRGLQQTDFTSERMRTFFRTLERPVEVENMPASFRQQRDMLLGRGLRWLVGLRAECGEHLGAVALGLRWRCQAAEPTDEIRDLMEITAEALLRLRESQRRSDLTVGLLEDLLTGSDADADAETGDPVTALTVEAVRLLATELGLAPDQERDLVLGALLRNVGQGQPAPDDRQADRLSGAQWEAFRAHPDAGERKLAALNAPASVRDAIRHHHEQFDGRGFPAGLKGRDIPLVARLVAVAQCYALHRTDGHPDGALEAVREQAGKALDPDLVDIFTKAHRRAGLESVPA